MARDFLDCECIDLNTTAIEFLITDLETALVFMDVVQTSGDQEVKQRNHTNAHVAYDTVTGLLSKVKPTAAQRQAIDERLTLLKARLEAVGELF
jgi:hypothetical protein